MMLRMPPAPPQRPIYDALLGQTGLFGSLTVADREAVTKRMTSVAFAAGQVIFSRGDTGHELYLLLEGRIRLSVITSEGRELALAHATRGDLFGEIATLDGGKRTADAMAIAASRALSLSASALADLMAIRPQIAGAVVRFLCRRLRETDHKLEAIALQSIEERLARFLLTLVEREGSKRAGAGTAIVSLGMSQGELALLLGATRPKVNIALMALEQAGGFQRQGDKLCCDVAVLEQIAWGGSEAD
jgi:CRP/FNR family transcriptional regulator, cyclic AMP receptor protein